MSFEEWLCATFTSDSGVHLDAQEIGLMKAAYRAGLLHAAEQDDGLAKMNKHLGASQYEYSAVCHRESASEVK